MRYLLAVLGIAACGDNSTGIAFADLEAAQDQARCDRFVRCGLFVDEAACDGFFRKQPNDDLKRAIDAGFVQYSGPAAERCVVAQAAQSCDTSSRNARIKPPECDDVFRGTQRVGDSCTFNEECGSGVCDVPQCGELCCAGVCHARLASEIDEACQLDVDCVGDAFCGDSVCHPLGGDGTACTDDHECDYGFACIGASSLMAGSCHQQPLIGEPCLYLRCSELGAVCTNGTCVALGLPGSACTSANDCSPFAICDGTRCRAFSELGEPCSSGCAGEAWCNGTCVPPEENATACSADNQCASLYCEEGPVFDSCGSRPPCF